MAMKGLNFFISFQQVQLGFCKKGEKENPLYVISLLYSIDSPMGPKLIFHVYASFECKAHEMDSIL